MRYIIESQRIKSIEQQWGESLPVLFYDWHWKENLMHRQIAERVSIPRPTITRWFNQFKIPTQSCTRFTNKNLLSFRLDERYKSRPKIKKDFPWKFNNDFFKEWSRKMAYVLGFLFADGYLQRNSRGSSCFCFVSTDREIIEKIRDLLQSNHKIGIKLRNKAKPQWKDAYVLQIGSKVVFDNLEKFGLVQNKSLTIKFPYVPDKFLGDFVRGYFDGDGGAHLGKYWHKDRKQWKWQFITHFTSGSEEFLFGLQSRLRSYLKGGKLSKKSRGGYALVFSVHDSVALFDLMYNNISSEIFLERKYDIFQKAFKILKVGT